jgi:hypothetical protein
MRIIIMLGACVCSAGGAAPAVQPLDTPEAEVQRLLRAGYHASMHGGQLLYCRDAAVTGSQFASRECARTAKSPQLCRERVTPKAGPNLQMG